MSTTSSFCSCIKKVKKTLKRVPTKRREGRAIAICVKSVLQTRGRTIKRFRCLGKRPYMHTQKKRTIS